MKVKTLIINLNPEENIYYRLYGLINNPFAGFDYRGYIEQIEEGLRMGVTKKALPKFLRRIGLSDNAIAIIHNHVEEGEKYQVTIKWDEERKEGGITIKKLKAKRTAKKKKLSKESMEKLRRLLNER